MIHGLTFRMGACMLRCFPHCCPQHVTRSYCGASVYLQVDLDELIESAAGNSNWDSDQTDTYRDDNLLVFGRFRLQDAQRPAVSDMISMDVINHSLHSDTNPTGEWVSSKMIASAGHVCEIFFFLAFDPWHLTKRTACVWIICNFTRTRGSLRSIRAPSGSTTGKSVRRATGA